MNSRSLRTPSLIGVVLVLTLAGCAESQQEKQTNKVINEVQDPSSHLRRSLHKAAEHLPPGSTPEQQAALAQEEAEAAHMTPGEAARIVEEQAAHEHP